MRLIKNSDSGTLQGYAATQSSTAGWKEICCTKVMTTSYTTTATVRLDVTSGNPDLQMTVFWTWQAAGTSSANCWWWGQIFGYRCLTNGTPDNPTGNGAVGDARFIETYYNGGSSDINTPTTTFSTRRIDFNSRTGNIANVNYTHHIRVFSGRIDQVSLSCV